MTFSTLIVGVVCLFVGACVGLLTAALCCMAREGDK
jgi:hypothetical protein